MAVQLAQGVLKSRENTSSPWENIMVEVSPNNDTNTLAAGFAADYDSTNTYNTGDLCTHEGGFYKCKTDGVSGTWNSTRWDFIDVDTIKSNIEGIIGDGQLDASFTATDLTGAANELEEKVGSDPLETTAQDLSGGVNELKNTLNLLDTDKADEASLALRRSGATNTGAQIEVGTFFYLDGILKQAIATIAQNASFTAQNCETVTDGALNSIKETTITVTTDNIGNVRIFSDKIVDILSLIADSIIGLPFTGYGNTYGKFFTATTTTLDPAANRTLQVKVIYRE